MRWPRPSSRTTTIPAIGDDRKGKASVVLYALALPTDLWIPLAACAVYALVAAIWLVPDRRIERAFGAGTG